MTNKKEHKILRKTLSLTLAMLVSILGLPLAKPQQVSATETSDPKYLSSITIDATASSSWDNKYDADFYDILTNENNAKYEYDSGYAMEQTALVIKTAAELAAFARAVNVGGKDFSGKYVKLTANIDLGGTDPTIEKTISGDKFSLNITDTASNVWVPIGNDTTHFNGTFDGDGHEVSNMTVLVKQTDSAAYAGLFGYIWKGSIKNTGVTGNVYASSSSSSYVEVGGLVGENHYGSIINSYSKGNVYAYSPFAVNAGGLVGESYYDVNIISSYATGDVYVYSSSVSVGGLIGSDDGDIINSYATGDVYVYSSSAYVGGLAGYSSYDSIINNYAMGNVYASSDSHLYVGGLVGYSGGSSITNSYATGNVYVYSSSAYVGGLAGNNSSRASITNSYVTGNVSVSYSSYAYAGGLVGSNDSRASISNSYVTGNVSASSSSSSSYVGGLVGEKSDSSSITNSYYYSGATIDGGTGATILKDGTELTMDQMTGTGEGRATEKMEGFKDSNDWTFWDDGIGLKYLPRVKSIDYVEERNPAPRFVVPAADCFYFSAPANLTYDGSAKEATVTSKISEIPNDKITIKYYSSTGTNLTSAPTNAGTYIVKIDVAACDKYEAQTDITADHWTFTIAKADPTIKSIATSVTYKTGLTLKDVPYPSTTGNTAGSWSWTYPSSSISAGTYTYSAKYTPTDTTNYNSVTKSITVTVNKGTPTINSTSTTATYAPSLTLAKISLPSTTGNTAGSWTWLNSSTPISSAGTHYFEAKFKPTNTNYNEVTKCILVTVSKATLQASDFNFAAPSNLEYSADYKTATITRKSGIKGIGELTVKYFTKVNGELTPLEGSSAPVNVGTYYVGINVGDDLNYNSVSGLTSNSWNFTITPAGKHTYRLRNDSRIYLVTK